METEQIQSPNTSSVPPPAGVVDNFLTVTFTESFNFEALCDLPLPEVDPHDVMEIRNALKLAAKVMGAVADQMRKEGLPRAAQQTETAPAAAAFLLAGAGESRVQIIAAFLHDAYRVFPELRGKILRSFGREVLELLDNESTMSLRERAKLEQALSFAAETAEFGNPEIALQQYPASDRGRYTTPEIERIQKALVFAGDLYDGARRSWGAHECLPMFAHAADVGLLLALSSVPADVVAAGILHDALERYNINGRSRDQIRTELQETFDPRVVALIEAVTEPREGESWHERKLRVVINIAAAWRRDPDLGRDAATVLCASKTSTIASGNKWLYQGVAAGRPEEIIARWSGGSYHENLEHFKQLRALCRITGVPEVLVGQLSEEITRFEKPSPTTRNRRYVAPRKIEHPQLFAGARQEAPPLYRTPTYQALALSR